MPLNQQSNNNARGRDASFSSSDQINSSSSNNSFRQNQYPDTLNSLRPNDLNNLRYRNSHGGDRSFISSGNSS